MKQTPTLSETVRDLVRARPAALPLREIAKNAQVSEHWLASLTRTKHPSSASADRCQRVYEYLTGKPLIKE